MLCALPFAFALGLCPDETVSGYAETETVWQLAELDGTPFQARATITFPQEGTVAGQAPCNSYTATQSVPIPWIDIRDIAATRMACPDLDSETVFFAALQEMTLVEVTLDILLLSTPEGREMVFKARPD
jgi:heat shock protein HslJ